MPLTPPSHSSAPLRSGVSVAATVAVYVLLVTVFALDVATELGLAVGMLYVPLVLLAFFVAGPRQVVVVTGLGVALTVLGALVSPPPGGPLRPEFLAANRVLAVVGLLTCGWFATTVLRGRLHLEAGNRSLRQARDQVDQQTRLLEIAGEVGRFGGWSVDVAADRVHWSREAATMHGVDPGSERGVAEAIGLYAPEDQPRVREAYERCVRFGEPFDLELQLVSSDGTVRWVNTVGRASRRGPDGEVLVVDGAIQDITDRIHAQLDAARHRQTVAMLGDSLPFIYWTATPEGDIDYISPELWRYTGVLTQDALGDAWLDVLHPDDRVPTVERWTTSLETGEPYTTHFRLRRADGAYRWHLVRATPERDAAGAVVKWWGSATDVHDLRTLETRASDLARRLNETLESIGDAVLALDRDWRITFVNAHAERLLQHERDQLLGRVVWDVFADARGTVFQEQYERAVAEGRPARFDAPFEPLGIHADIAAYPHEHGLTIYFRDVSEQRALEARLLQAQKLEAVGRLTGGIARDFHDLLAGVLADAGTLATEVDDPNLRALAEAVRDGADRAAGLTHSLLAFAGQQPLAPEPVDVNALVRGMADLLARALGDGVELQCTLAEGLPSCHVDRGQLESAVLNLCLNGRDAMGGQGRLTVTTSRVTFDAGDPAEHAEATAGDYVCLAVEDEGPGVSPGDGAHLFEPFFTTKETGQGAGLGLAMVYGLMKQSGGHVDVVSEPGRGATFLLYLPVASERRTTPPPGGETAADRAATHAGTLPGAL